MAPKISFAPGVMPQRRRLGNVHEAADLLHVIPVTVRRMIARGELTAYRVGKTRAIRVDLDEVEALLIPIVTAGGAA